MALYFNFFWDRCRLCCIKLLIAFFFEGLEEFVEIGLFGDCFLELLKDILELELNVFCLLDLLFLILRFFGYLFLGFLFIGGGFLLFLLLEVICFGE